MFISILNDKINNLVLFKEPSNEGHRTGKLSLPDPISQIYFFPTEDIMLLSTELFARVRLCVPIMRISQVFGLSFLVTGNRLEVHIIAELFQFLEVYIFRGL